MMDKLTRKLDPVWEWLLNETPEDNGLLSCGKCWTCSQEKPYEELTMEERLSRSFDDFYVGYIDPEISKPRRPSASSSTPSLPAELPPIPAMPTLLGQQKTPWLKRIRSSKNEPTIDLSGISKQMSSILIPERKRSFQFRKRT